TCARDRVRRHPRARPEVPPLHGPAAQGRAADRPLRAGRRRPGERSSDPRSGVRLPAADPRAGRRGLPLVARARTRDRPPPTGRDVMVPIMQLGMIGLGRMGSGMTERRREGGHVVGTYARKVEDRTAASFAELKEQLDPPRAFWLMVPSGKITEDVFQELLGIAEPGDTIVDGGNSNFRDSKRRYV